MLELGRADVRELIAAQAAIAAELAARPAPESGLACMDAAQRLSEAIDVSEAALAGLVRRVDLSGEVRGWGFACTTAWLAAGLGMRAGRAKERLVLARQLDRLPRVAKLAAGGELSYGYATTIADSVARLNDADAEAAEQIMLEWVAEEWTPQMVARRAVRIHDIVGARDGTERPDEDTRHGYEHSWLTIAGSLDGGAFVKGWLNPELKTLVKAALGPLAKPAGADDERDHARRLADALESVLSQGGRHWNATLVIDWATLTGGGSSQADGSGQGGGSSRHEPSQGSGKQSGGSGQPTGSRQGFGSRPASGERRIAEWRAGVGHEGSAGGGGPGAAEAGAGAGEGGAGRAGARLLDGTPIPPERARRIAENAGISALILGPEGLPLYLGRKVRFATVAQRRALEVLYETCATDGCDIPATVCEIDHVRPYAAGGLTDIDALAPSCSFHNRYRADHPGRVTVGRRPDGRWRFTMASRHRRC